MKGTVKTFVDFSGGYHSNTPSSFMGDPDLAVADNCYWRNGATMRKGYSVKATFPGQKIIGFLRSGISGAMLDYIVTKAVAGGAINLNIENGLTYTVLPLAVISYSEIAVQVVEYSGLIVITGHGGYSRASIVTLTNGVYAETTIDALDVRTREFQEWSAGSTDGESFTDATVAAQGGPWLLAAASGQGFYIASDFVCNRLEITGLTAPVSSAVVKISNGLEWITVEPKVLTLGAGAIDIEFDLPFSGNELTFTPSKLGTPIFEQYVIQVLLTFSGAAPSGVISQVKNTQYFSQITGNELQTYAEVYKSMLCLVSGNTVNFSQADQITEWAASDVEIFVDGGAGITKIINFEESMLVFKRRALYGFSGNSLNNPTTTRFADVGTSRPDSVVVVEGGVMFTYGDKIMFFDGSMAVEVGKHIASSVSGKLALAAVAVKGPEGHYLVMGGGVGFLLNPASVRKNGAGDYIMSSFRFTNHTFTGAAVRADTGSVVGWNLDTLYNLFDGTTDNGATILMEMVTKHLDFGLPGQQKRYFRIKLLDPIHNDETGTVLLRLTADKTRTIDCFITDQELASVPYYNIPYEMDGFTLAVKFAAYSITGASILGFALDMKGGTF